MVASSCAGREGCLSLTWCVGACGVFADAKPAGVSGAEMHRRATLPLQSAVAYCGAMGATVAVQGNAHTDIVGALWCPCAANFTCCMCTLHLAHCAAAFSEHQVLGQSGIAAAAPLWLWYPTRVWGPKTRLPTDAGHPLAMHTLHL